MDYAWATTLNLNMGYKMIGFGLDAGKNIMLSWGMCFTKGYLWAQGPQAPLSQKCVT